MTTAVDVVLAYDKNNVNPGALGFIIVALLGVATWLLIRSMHRQLGKVDFDEGDGLEETVEPGPSDSGTSDSQR
jgi:hypothetical protein